MSSQRIMFIWKNHQSLKEGKFIHFFEKNLFTDCSLVAEGKILKVHKIIVSVFSQRFENMLKGFQGMPVFHFNQISFQDLNALVHYMYYGKVVVLEENITTFLSAADYLKIEGLKDAYDNWASHERRRRCKGRSKETIPSSILPCGHSCSSCNMSIARD